MDRLAWEKSKKKRNKINKKKFYSSHFMHIGSYKNLKDEITADIL